MKKGFRFGHLLMSGCFFTPLDILQENGKYGA